MTSYFFNLLQIFLVYSMCDFQDVPTIDFSANYLNYSVQVNIEEQINSGSNFGFGLWMRYMPMRKFYKDEDIQVEGQRNYFSEENKQAWRKEEKFIVSMQTQSTQNSQLILTQNFNDQSKMFDHIVYIHFKNTIKVFSIELDYRNYEGEYIIFYINFDLKKKLTTLGFFRLYNHEWLLTNIYDLPLFANTISFDIGGQLRKEKFNQNIYIFQNFIGDLSGIFMTTDTNPIENGFQDCLWIGDLEINCTPQKYPVVIYNYYFTGEYFFSFFLLVPDFKMFEINGWVKLDLLEQVSKESSILRLNLDVSYEDDENLGDRLVYLKYFQNQNSLLNGFEVSTQSYIYPVIYKYKTQPSDIISNFGQDYSEIFTKWHNIQFKTNFGRTQFNIYSPEKGFYKFQWDNIINYFSFPSLTIHLGGDKYSKTLFKGWLDKFLYISSCSDQDYEFLDLCYHTCKTCDGPSEFSCTSCNDDYGRVFEELYQTCDCKDNYYIIVETLLCGNLDEIKVIATGQFLDQIGRIQCEFGYFLTQNGCIQCPYFTNYLSKSQIICADCYLNSQKFANDLKCSYDYYSYKGEQDNAYDLYQRNYDEIEIFQIDYSRINLLKSESNFTIQYCDDSYFYLNHTCHTIQNCDQIQIVNNNQLECQQCQQGYSLFNNECNQCGDNCGSCNSDNLCFYCKDSKKYYLTFDGHFCKKCSIQYCIFCFAYYYKNDQIYSTLDYNFQFIDFEQIKIFEGCALCQENYFFNFQNQKCEQKCQNIQVSQTIQECLTQFQDCSFGVTTLGGQIQCVKSLNQLSSIQSTKCQQYKNCKECINPSQLLEQPQCVVCDFGYYVDLLSGSCIQCPKECLQCLQQNYQYQDYWKQSIHGFHSFVFNQDGQKPFLQNAILRDQKQLEIICFQCSQGYVIFNNKCIKGCDAFCSECKIINGVSKCIKCPKTSNGFLRTKSKDGICLECPNNCAACLQRSEEEIKQYNPYFIKTDETEKQTHGCFELFNYQPEFNLYLDQNSLMPVRCDSNTQCYTHMWQEIIIACSPDEDIHQYNPQFSYYLENIFYEVKWGYEMINKISFAKLSVQQVYQQFTMIQGSAESCQLQKGAFINTRLREQVFSIKQVNTEILGSKQGTIISILKSFEIYNFTDVVFTNFIFRFQNDQQDIDNLFSIIFNTLDENFTIIFQNCTFTSQKFESIELNISVNKPYNLIMRNVQFQSIKIKNSILFSQNFDSNSKYSITLQNFTITESYFVNTTLFQLIYLNNTSQQVILNEDIEIISSQFNQFTFLQIQSNYLLRKTYLYIKRMKIQQSTFKNSLVFLQKTLLFFNIENFEIISAQFNDITFFYIFNLNLNHVILKDINNYNSSFISNQYQIPQQFQEQKEKIEIVFNNISLSDISTDNNLQFFKLQNFDNLINFTVKFDQFFLSNIHSVSKDFNTLMLIDQQCLIDLECEFCFINNLQIERSYGIIEFKLSNSKLVKLFKIEVNQFNQHQKVLHASLDCAQNNFLPYLSFMIISSYQDIFISNLLFKDCIIYNMPLIKILGFDAKQVSVNESITLIDSEFFKIKSVISNNMNSGVSIIHFSSNQESKIILNNITFSKNILHSYVQKQKVISSSTLLFQTNKAIIQFQNSIFTKNLATNTSNSILYINSLQLNLLNLSFDQNNQINNQVILDSLLYQKISYSALNNLFPIKSLGGNGYLLQNSLIMVNISIKSSSSDEGGCFYIEQNGKGSIIIKNSVFSETQTSFSNSSNSEGGCFYFDSSNSIFSLKISSSIFNQTYSYKQGGAIFINPSKIQNKISLFDLHVTNTFSLKNSFISYQSFQIQNAKSEIKLNNVKFNQSNNGFEIFLSKFNGFGLKYTPSPLILISFGNVTLQNIVLIDSYLQFFIKIEDGCLVNFEDIIIVNNTIFNNQLITINLNTNLSGQIIFKRVNIRQIQWISQSINTLNNFECQTKQNNLNYKDIEVGCQLNFDQNQQTKIVEYNITNQEVEYLACNKKIIFQEIQNISSLISFQITNKLQKINIVESTFEQFYCKTCIDGIINIIIQNNDYLKQILITDTKLLNNYCGLNGCINIQSKYTNNQNLRFLSQNIPFNDYLVALVIKQTQFINNEAEFGGALYLNSISGIISESTFQKNKAKKGGAIYYISQKMQLYLVNTQISNNKAEIAGGIYMKNLVLEKIQNYEVQIINNNSSNFANDLSENPTSLTISMDGSKTFLDKIIISNSSEELIEQINITKNFDMNINQWKYILFPSGIKIQDYQYFNEEQQKFIPLNLSLRIVALNSFNQQEKQLENAQCTLKQKVMNIQTKQEEAENKFSYLSQTNISFNDTSSDFNLDNLKIYFNPLYSTDYFLRIIIQCNMIVVPIYDQNYNTQNYITNYQLYFDIQTYPCQIGEYLNHQTGECVICDAKQNLYSLVKNASNCTYKDNVLIDEFTSATIQLRPGYWRAQNNSTKIEQCLHFLTNCLGGWITGDDSCSGGHIGALCEQCDLYNVKNQGSFSRSNKYQCGNCNQITGNIIILIVASLWIILSIMLSVDSTIQNIKQIILNQQFYILGLSLSTSKYSAAVLVKFLTNYLQIIANLESFQIKIPQFLNGLFTSIGNPITQMSYSYDCFLVSILSIEINYFRIIWIFIQVLFFISIYILIQALNNLLFKKQFKLSSIYTALLFIYVYINLSLIENLIQQLSYRNISDIKWVQGNVSIYYDSEKHQKWIYELIIPIFIIFGFLLPLFLFTQINKQKNMLNNSKSLTIWGYLTIDYKNDSYYWELVKIIQRQILVLIINYYEDYTIVKASLVVIVLYSYSLIQTIQNPYKNNRLNQLEGNIMKVCSVSIILGSCIYLAQNNQNLVITWAFELALIILNSSLFIYLIMLLIKAYVEQFQDMGEKLFSIFQKVFPTIFFKHQSIRNFFVVKNNKQQKISQLKARIRKLIMPYVKQSLDLKKTLFLSQNMAKGFSFSQKQQSKQIPILQIQQDSESSKDL